MQRLQDRVTVVTGAGSGIGLASVRRLAAEGAVVVAVDIDEAAGKAAAEQAGGTFIAADVSNEDDVQRMYESVADRHGRVDVAFHNAGISPPEDDSILSTGLEAWRRVQEVNLTSVYLCCREAIPHMQRQGKGSIINTSSLAGQRGGPGLTAYSASKGAVIAFSTALAMELAPDNIRVNAICPGWVDTAFNQPAIDFMGGRATQEEVVRRIVPLRRQAQPHEIAPLFVYLASDESSYVTAQAITIDGGVYN